MLVNKDDHLKQTNKQTDAYQRETLSKWPIRQPLRYFKGPHWQYSLSRRVLAFYTWMNRITECLYGIQCRSRGILRVAKSHRLNDPRALTDLTMLTGSSIVFTPKQTSMLNFNVCYKNNDTTVVMTKLMFPNKHNIWINSTTSMYNDIPKQKFLQCWH